MHLFGLTGGIASGKSSVAAWLRSRDVPVIDADELAREAVAPQKGGLRALVAEFGAAILDEQGALDRGALARIAFSDERARARLNAITHPIIAQLTAERAQELDAGGEPLACYEAALIVESGNADLFRPLVVVVCPEDVQLARIMARDGLSRQEALQRVHAQKPLVEKVAVADFVVDTTGPIDETRRRVDTVLRAICATTGVRPERYLP